MRVHFEHNIYERDPCMLFTYICQSTVKNIRTDQSQRDTRISYHGTVFSKGCLQALPFLTRTQSPPREPVHRLRSVKYVVGLAVCLKNEAVLLGGYADTQ